MRSLMQVSFTAAEAIRPQSRHRVDNWSPGTCTQGAIGEYDTDESRCVIQDGPSECSAHGRERRVNNPSVRKNHPKVPEFRGLEGTGGPEGQGRRNTEAENGEWIRQGRIRAHKRKVKVELQLKRVCVHTNGTMSQGAEHDEGRRRSEGRRRRETEDTDGGGGKVEEGGGGETATGTGRGRREGEEEGVGGKEERGDEEGKREAEGHTQTALGPSSRHPRRAAAIVNKIHLHQQYAKKRDAKECARQIQLRQAGRKHRRNTATEFADAGRLGPEGWHGSIEKNNNKRKYALVWQMTVCEENVMRNVCLFGVRTRRRRAAILLLAAWVPSRTNCCDRLRCFFEGNGAGLTSLRRLAHVSFFHTCAQPHLLWWPPLHTREHTPTLPKLPMTQHMLAWWSWEGQWMRILQEAGFMR